MFKYKILLGIFLFIISTNTALGEVKIKQVPLRSQDIAHMGGDEVFDYLCSACHGAGGKGDGPAISALNKGAPDLTLLSANNGGVYSHKEVEK